MGGWEVLMVPMVMVDVTEVEGDDLVKDAGIGMGDVAAGRGESNEPDIPASL